MTLSCTIYDDVIINGYTYGMYNYTYIICKRFFVDYSVRDGFTQIITSHYGITNTVVVKFISCVFLDSTGVTMESECAKLSHI